MASKPSSIDDFYDAITAQELSNGYTAKKSGKEVSADKVFGKITDILIDTRDEGVLDAKQIVEQLTEFKKNGAAEQSDQLNDLVQIYHEGEKVTGAKYEHKLMPVLGLPPRGENANLAVICSNTPRVSQAVRGVNNITKFLTVIPTLEMSRAVPYLDINFELPVEAISEGGQLQTFSALKFLLGAEKVKGPDETIAKGTNFNYKNIQGKTEQGSRTGMEVFTMPQTLQNLDFKNKSLRAATVIDPFRPLMSVDSFEVDAAPAIGLISFKNARLNLTVHDRSRLAEVHQFVKPETYTRTKLTITYGWMHPDDITKGNHYGDLINKMRVTEKFGVANASFTFDNVGQIKVQLQLYAAGANDMKAIRIADSDDFENMHEQIGELTSLIGQCRDKLGLRPMPGQAEVRVDQLLDGAERGTLIVLDDEDKKKMKELTSKLRKDKSKAAAKELADLLDKLYTDKNDKSLSEQIKNSIGDILKAKKSILIEKEDPFLEDKLIFNPKILQTIEAMNGKKSKGEKRNNKVTSLAKLLLVFVGLPLACKEDLFDEIQFVYYPLNDSAGHASGLNLGALPIEIDTFFEFFNQYAKSKGSPNLPLAEFVKFVYDVAIDDLRSPAYGFRDLYQKRTALDKQPEVEKKFQQKDISDRQAEITNGGVFRKPVIEMYIETLPRRDRKLTPEKLAQKKKLGLPQQDSILRIHLFDKIASPYNGYTQLLEANKGLARVIGTNENRNHGGGDAAVKNQVKAALALFDKNNKTGLKLEGDENGFELKGSIEEIKKFVKAIVPSITYGTNNSNVINASVQTQQDQLVSAANMQKWNKPSAAEPAGTAQGGLPLRVFPGQVEFNMLGCPLLAINNQFFIDFGTSTTLDNIYLVNKLSHVISPGKFESKCTLTFLEGYGTYESVASKVKQIQGFLKKLK